MMKMLKVFLLVVFSLTFINCSIAKNYGNNVLRKAMSKKKHNKRKSRKKYTKKGKLELVEFTSTSTMTKYNPNATWKKVDCKYCNGTGSQTKTVYGKHNRCIKLRVQCQYCKGRGYKGMSKK